MINFVILCADSSISGNSISDNSVSNNELVETEAQDQEQTEVQDQEQTEVQDQEQTEVQDQEQIDDFVSYNNYYYYTVSDNTVSSNYVNDTLFADFNSVIVFLLAGVLGALTFLVFCKKL